MARVKLCPAAVFSFKGEKSQTGLAARERWPNIPLSGSNESFHDIALKISGKKAVSLGILPFWNSHAGEISGTEILDLVFDGQSQLHEVWPKRVRFSLVSKSGRRLSEIRRVVSVGVAKDQCSRFIEKAKLDFVSETSTIEASTTFKNRKDVDGILCAPEQCAALGEGGICVEEVANSTNFTSFALVGSLPKKKWSPKAWPALKRAMQERTRVWGVEMDLPNPTLGEAQHQFLDDMGRAARSIDEVPKVIFVARRANRKCAILFEGGPGEDQIPAQLLDESDEQHSDVLRVKPKIGVLSDQYTRGALSFLGREFPGVTKRDFTMHIGTRACVFICPALGIVAHGFEEDVLDNIVRRVLDRLFGLIDGSLPCTASQKSLFNRHKATYYRKGARALMFYRA